MPDDFDRYFSITVFDRSNVREKIVLLRGIVVQPANDVVHRGRIDVDYRFAPDHFAPLDRTPEFVSECGRGWIRLRVTVLHSLRSGRLSTRRCATGAKDVEARHRPDLVWFTELP